MEQALGRNLHHLDPGRVALSSTLSQLVRRTVRAGSDPDWQSDPTLFDADSGYTETELRFAAGDSEAVLAEIRSGALPAYAGLLEAASIAADVYGDPVLLGRVLALTREIAQEAAAASSPVPADAPAKPKPRLQPMPKLKLGATAQVQWQSWSPGTQRTVHDPVLAMEVPGQADAALALLMEPGLFRSDSLLDQCFAGPPASSHGWGTLAAPSGQRAR